MWSLMPTILATRQKKDQVSAKSCMCCALASGLLKFLSSVWTVWTDADNFGMFWNVLECFGMFWNVLECFGMFALLLGCDKMQLRYLDSSVCDYRAWPRFAACHVPGLNLSGHSKQSCLPSKAFPSCPHRECQT